MRVINFNYMKKITVKQEKFCNEYIRTGNASEAYRLAYNCENMKIETIKNNAYKLLNQNDISTTVKELQKEIAERNKISIDECVSLLAKMARFDIADVYDENGDLKPIKEIDKDSRISIEEVNTESYFDKSNKSNVFVKKLKVGNKKTAIDMLMKHLGGYEKDNNQKSTKLLGEIPKDERAEMLEELILKYKKSSEK